MPFLFPLSPFLTPSQLLHLHLTRNGKLAEPEIDLICRELPGLLTLNLSGTLTLNPNSFPGCFQLGNRCCELIGLNLLELKELDISYCQYITDEGLFHLSQCVNLERIGLASLGEITEKGIERLVSDCSFLTSIDLANCPRVGSNAVAVRFL